MLITVRPREFVIIISQRLQQLDIFPDVSVRIYVKDEHEELLQAEEFLHPRVKTVVDFRECLLEETVVAAARAHFAVFKEK